MPDLTVDGRSIVRVRLETEHISTGIPVRTVAIRTALDIGVGIMVDRRVGITGGYRTDRSRPLRATAKSRIIFGVTGTGVWHARLGIKAEGAPAILSPVWTIAIAHAVNDTTDVIMGAIGTHSTWIDTRVFRARVIVITTCIIITNRLLADPSLTGTTGAGRAIRLIRYPIAGCAIAGESAAYLTLGVFADLTGKGYAPARITHALAGAGSVISTGRGSIGN